MSLLCADYGSSDEETTSNASAGSSTTEAVTSTGSDNGNSISNATSVSTGKASNKRRKVANKLDLPDVDDLFSSVEAPSFIQAAAKSPEIEYTCETTEKQEKKEQPKPSLPEETDSTRRFLAMVRSEQKKLKSREELTFNQREKRKRNKGQCERAKNYVEEEKRILRQSTTNMEA